MPAPYIQQWDPIAHGAPAPNPPPKDERPPRAGWAATIGVVVLVVVAVATGVVMLGRDDPRPPEDTGTAVDDGADDRDEARGDDRVDTSEPDGFVLPEGEVPEDAYEGGSGTIPYTTDPDPFAGLPDVTRDQMADALASVFRRDLAECVADTLIASLPQASFNRVYYATSTDELTAFEARETNDAWRSCFRRLGPGG